MGFFGKLVGNKNATMWCCFDIAKPILAVTEQNVIKLAKYKEVFKQEDRLIIAIMIEMHFVHLYMHIFDRLFIEANGQQKLIKAQKILFQVIDNEFRKPYTAYLGDYESYNTRFYKSFNILELLLSECEGVIPHDKSIIPNDNSVVSVFSKAISGSDFNSSDVGLITDISQIAMDGFISLFMTPKMQNTLVQLASLV